MLPSYGRGPRVVAERAPEGLAKHRTEFHDIEKNLASKLHWHTERNRILRLNRYAMNRLRNGIILGKLSRRVRPGGLFFLGHDCARAISHLKFGRVDAPLLLP